MWTAIALSVMLSVPGLAQVPAGSRDSISISIEMQRDMRALAGSADSLVCEGPSEQAGAGGRICTKPGRNSVLAVVRSDREFAFVTRWLELKSETEVPATDSTLALLEVAYGSPTMCARDAFRFPAYPQHYLWHSGRLHDSTGEHGAVESPAPDPVGTNRAGTAVVLRLGSTSDAARYPVRGR